MLERNIDSIQSKLRVYYISVYPPPLPFLLPPSASSLTVFFFSPCPSSTPTTTAVTTFDGVKNTIAQKKSASEIPDWESFEVASDPLDQQVATTSNYKEKQEVEGGVTYFVVVLETGLEVRKEGALGEAAVGSGACGGEGSKGGLFRNAMDKVQCWRIKNRKAVGVLFSGPWV